MDSIELQKKERKKVKHISVEERRTVIDSCEEPSSDRKSYVINRDKCAEAIYAIMGKGGEV